MIGEFKLIFLKKSRSREKKEKPEVKRWLQEERSETRAEYLCLGSSLNLTGLWICVCDEGGIIDASKHFKQKYVISMYSIAFILKDKKIME